MAQSTDSQRAMSNYKSGTRSGREVNDAAVKNSAKSTHNVFPMSYPFGQTARYAEIGAFFAMNAEARDVIPLKSSFELRSLALKSPKMTPLYMKRAYFEVKHNAILPRTFQYIYKNPVQGDDVPEDAYCNYVSLNGTSFTQHLIDRIDTDLVPSVVDDGSSDAFIRLVRSLLVIESIYSNGSLLASLGCPLNGYVVGSEGFVFDAEISRLWELLLSPVVHVGGGRSVLRFTFPDLPQNIQADQSSNYYAVSDTPIAGVVTVGIDRMLELLRSYNPSVVQYVNTDGVTFNLNDNRGVNEISNGLSPLFLASYWLPPQGIDVSRLAAYQLTCAEWYTNDKVDFIYNADLWRKAMDFYVRQVVHEVYFFEYNNIAVMYDALSRKNFEAMQAYANPYDDSYDMYLDFLSNLFFFNRSLKFEDYFSGARTRPLAVGDNRISDSDDPIEVVRGIQITRFLNAVNRAGVDEDYLAQIYGTTEAPDDTRPKWIATYDDRIDSFEVNNTAQDQGKMTTALRSFSSEDHEYTAVRIEGYPSIIIGLYSFEMPRLYVQAIDRDFFVKDRFDMFNPYYQYDGDQKIYRSELYPIIGDADDASFAYTGRDNHRKLRFGRATGGFVRNLPSWAFLVDDKQSGVPFSNLNPEYILSSASEFDRFFSGFADHALDGYFHFIISFLNTCNAVRPMEFAPAILNG